MSHTLRGGLILITKKCSGAEQIDVIVDVHIKVSRVRVLGVTVENHVKYTDATEKYQIEKYFFIKIYRILLIKRPKYEKWIWILASVHCSYSAVNLTPSQSFDRDSMTQIYRVLQYHEFATVILI
jgi:hypothetical protein